MKKNAAILVTLTALGLLFGGSVRSQASVANYQTAVVAEPSLTSYYTFDSHTANDSLGANNGTLQGSANYANGIGGGPDAALNFSGVGDFDNLGVVPAFDFTSGKGTVELWVKADASIASAGNYDCIIASGAGGGGRGYAAHLANGTTLLVANDSGFGDTDWFTLPASIGTGWHHFALIFTNNTVTVVWDGQSLGSQTFHVGLVTGHPAHLGEWNGLNWIGNLDEVAFYSDALPLSSIQAHIAAYNNSAALPVIVTRPQGGSGVLGQSFQFSATVANGYSQWYKDNGPLLDQTNSVLSLASLAVSDAGTYTLVATNSAGSITSSPAVFTVSAIVPAVADYQAAVLAEPSLISYYKLDDHTANDSFGANNGTLQETASLGAIFGANFGGDPGSSLNGGAWIDFGVVPAFNFSSGNGTLECWLQAGWTVNPAYAPCIFASRDDGIIYSIHMTADKTAILFGNNGGANDNTTWAVPQPVGTGWHHLAVEFNAGNCTVIWDGKSVATNAEPLGAGGITNSVQVGASTPAGTEPWIGKLDEIAFYNAALPLGSVQAHRTAYEANLLPVINTQPQGGSGVLGQSFQFSVKFSTESQQLQWYKDSGLLSNQTNSGLFLTSLALSDAGTYAVVATSGGGSVTSSPAVFTVSALSASVAAYQAAVLAEPNLISYYTFDDHTARDDFGANNGTLQGTANFGAGFGSGAGSALNLDGSGWVNLGSVPAFDFPSDRGTVELWVQAGALAGNGCFFADRHGSTDYSIHMAQSKGSIIFWSGVAAHSMDLPSAAGTGWHHMAVVFDTGNWTVIWDGQSLATNALYLGGGSYEVQLGSPDPAGAGGENFVGKLDQVAFYSDALPLSSIQAHYAAYELGLTPVLITQPQGGIGVLGKSFQFSGTASSFPHYQWYKDSGLLSNQTNTVLSLTNLTLANAGTYTLVAANAGGSVTSSPAVFSVSALSPAVAGYEAAVLAESSLVSYYTFDDHTARDDFGANDGTLKGSPGFGAGFGVGAGSALSLDAGGWDSLGVVPAFDFQSERGTVELWVKAGASALASSGTYLCILANGVGRDYAVFSEPSRHQLLITEGLNVVNAYATLPAVLDTNWHHLALIFTNTTVTAVWDGQSLPFSDGQNPHPFQLGDNGYGQEMLLGYWPNTGNALAWGGELDEVAFYSEALPVSSIQNHYYTYAGFSPPVLTVAPSGNNVVISWSGLGPQNWVLESAPQLPASSWTPVGTNNSPATIQMNGQQFFRLKAQ
jgi:Concanavalin A-like lectin/glucanases superfamily